MPKKRRKAIITETTPDIPFQKVRVEWIDCVSDSGWATDKEFDKMKLARLREAALKKGSFSSAVNAEANRGKAAGLYIDRKIIKTGKLEDLSEQELEAKMKQILNDYAQIIDVTPPSITSESSLPTDEESSSDPQK